MFEIKDFGRTMCGVDIPPGIASPEGVDPLHLQCVIGKWYLEELQYVTGFSALTLKVVAADDPTNGYNGRTHYRLQWLKTD